jgi:hypothetical protein
MQNQTELPEIESADALFRVLGAERDNAWIGVIRGHVYRQASRSETAAAGAET